MEPDEAKALLADLNPEALLADGFDRALAGIGYRCGLGPIAIYDRGRCIEILMEDGMTETQAEEFFSFNVEGAYMGEGTPLYVQF